MRLLANKKLLMLPRISTSNENNAITISDGATQQLNNIEIIHKTHAKHENKTFSLLAWASQVVLGCTPNPFNFQLIQQHHH